MIRSVWGICWQEFVINRRNRWVISFTILFSGLTLLIAYFGMVTSGYAAFQDFIRTSASIINLGGFLIPMFALLLGVFSFLANPEYLELMVSQPVSRSGVLLGKYLGLVLTVLTASVLGFGLPGVVIALVIGVGGALQYLLVILYCLLLAIVFVGLSILISVLAGRRQIALGVALALWAFYELLHGIFMLGATLYLAPSTLRVVLLAGLLSNPIDIVRVLSLIEVGGVHLFGPAGATLIKMTGSAGWATAIGMIGMVAWIVVPIGLAARIFKRQNL